MPFSNAYHGAGEGERRHLGERIDAELRARIEDAVDYACLDAMVASRRARDARAPVSDDPRDREEFLARVRSFLERLRAALAAALTDEQRQRLGDAVARPANGDLEAALAAQVALAKELPDYWQRVETVRLSGERPEDVPPGVPAPSGRERRGLLDRLLGRG